MSTPPNPLTALAERCANVPCGSCHQCCKSEVLALIARADKYLNTGSGEYASEIMRDMADFLLRLAAKAADEGQDILLERERCAKIAEPWPGFWLDENSTDIDRAVVAVRTEIAEKIRAVRP